ncbi:MAG: DUF6062 family protein [Spirochaetales bacterium]
MKYRLETIPVWNAVENGAQCPLCFLADSLERQYVSFYLGDSVMTPEIRVQVNDIGFCPRHFQQMVDGGNRLGLSLMAATHIESVREKLADDRRVLAKHAAARSPGRRKAYRDRIERMKQRRDACLVCDRMDHTMRNYAYTLARLLSDDQPFFKSFSDSSGVCLDHLPFVLDVAQDALKPGERERLIATLFDLADNDLHDIHESLAEFADRFDYRNQKPMTDRLRRSVTRAVAKITGRTRVGPVSPSP